MNLPSFNNELYWNVYWFDNEDLQWKYFCHGGESNEEAARKLASEIVKDKNFQNRIYAICRVTIQIDMVEAFNAGFELVKSPIDITPTE